MSSPTRFPWLAAGLLAAAFSFFPVAGRAQTDIDIVNAVQAATGHDWYTSPGGNFLEQHGPVSISQIDGSTVYGTYTSGSIVFGVPGYNMTWNYAITSVVGSEGPLLVITVTTTQNMLGGTITFGTSQIPLSFSDIGISPADAVAAVESGQMSERTFEALYNGSTPAEQSAADDAVAEEYEGYVADVLEDDYDAEDEGGDAGDCGSGGPDGNSDWSAGTGWGGISGSPGTGGYWGSGSTGRDSW